ncbi:MAG: amino acid permease [Gammaproteobacteria bacterium]|nr:amino acid permease [Gammaproteobacteria bacterium]
MTDKKVQQSAPPATLKRNISLPLLTFYGLGTILGAGIYVLIGEVVAVSGMYAPLSFIIASFLAVFTAFSYAELSARYPKSAGEAVYVEAAFHHPHISLLMGSLVIMIGLVSSATLANGFVGYLQVFFELPDWLVLVLLIGGLGLIAAWGISESVWLATIITLLEVFGLLLIINVSSDALLSVPANLDKLLPEMGEGVWLGIMMGSFLAFYAYVGFEDMVNVAEEVKNPSHTMPRAIILALVVSSTLYLLVALVSVLSIPLEQLAGNQAPLAHLYQHVSGNKPTVISLISLVAVINGALIQIIMASRVLYGLSNQGWLPPIFSRVHPRRHTPLFSTMIVTLLILILALWFPLVTLAKTTSFVTLIVFAIVNVSLWKIQAKGMSGNNFVPRWVPIVGATVSLGFLLLQLV